MAKLLVTGGAGFIGSHLVDRLIEMGYQVVSIDNLMLGKKQFVNKQAVFHKLDIRNFAQLKKMCKGVEAIFHLAADPRLPVSIEKPIETHDINVTGTLNVLEAARQAGVKKVIFSSSCAVYGDQKIPIKETAVPAPVSPYGLHKLMGEEYCQLYSKLFGVQTVALRYFNVYGPRKLAGGSYPMVIPLFLAQKKRGEKLTVVGDGKATRDYVHVSDVVAANIKAWQSSVGDGSAYNIGTGRQISVNEIAKLVGGPVKHLPPRAGEMRFIEANVAQAKRKLGWKPQVQFEDGIEGLLSK